MKIFAFGVGLAVCGTIRDDHDHDHDVEGKGYDIICRPPQNVDVLVVLKFQIPCFRPESPAREDFMDVKEIFQDTGRRGRRRPEEP